MKIHIVTDQFIVGGGIEHIYQIVKEMKEVQFGIFAKSGNAVEKFQGLQNVKIYERGFTPGYVLKEKPDLVHIHHFRSLFSFLKNPLAKYHTPIIFTAHGMHVHKYEFSRSIASCFKYFLRTNLEKKLLKRIDQVIAVSREDKQFMEAKYNLKNVFYLTNGLDFSNVKIPLDPKNVLRERLNLPEDYFLFVTVARFNFQKGYDILIQSIHLLNDILKQKKVKFVFVGEGEEFEMMKNLCKELSISEYIIFLGERTDVFDIVKACDVFLLPSRWEGLPIVLIETGILKVPVVASDTYGNREILNGNRGIVFKNEDTAALSRVIRRIITGKVDLDGYSERLFEEIKANYNLKKMISGLRNIYLSYQQ